MTRIAKLTMMAATCVASFGVAAFGQAQPPVVITIDARNCVSYQTDTADLTKYATNANPTPAVTALNFNSFVNICDISQVNGAPAKGTVVAPNITIGAQPAQVGGRAIADITRANIHIIAWEIQTAEGRTVGSFMGEGFGGGVGVPGATAEFTQGNNVISGGTGAFFGVRGQWGTTAAANVPAPVASVSEDPSTRRTRPITGSFRQVLQLIPYEYPAVMSTADGPAVYHSDFTPVSASKPAAAGETLIVMATGLGPTVGGVLGQPFPPTGGPIQAVQSPVTVAVNGNSAPAINAIGWPGTNNTYRVDFQVPAGTTGPATIRITSAWIPGPAVTIDVQ